MQLQNPVEFFDLVGGGLGRQGHLEDLVAVVAIENLGRLHLHQQLPLLKGQKLGLDTVDFLLQTPGSGRG